MLLVFLAHINVRYNYYILYLFIINFHYCPFSTLIYRALLMVFLSHMIKIALKIISFFQFRDITFYEYACVRFKDVSFTYLLLSKVSATIINVHISTNKEVLTHALFNQELWPQVGDTSLTRSAVSIQTWPNSTNRRSDMSGYLF